MSEKARSLYIYIIASPHGNILGCFYLPKLYIMHDMQGTEKATTETVSELYRNGLITVCPTTQWIMVHRFLKWNAIQNPKQGISAMKVFMSIPDDVLVKSLIYKELLEYSGKMRDEEKTVLKQYQNSFDTVSIPLLYTDTVTVTVIDTVLEKGGVGEKTILEEIKTANPEKLTEPSEKSLDLMMLKFGKDMTEKIYGAMVEMKNFNTQANRDRCARNVRSTIKSGELNSGQIIKIVDYYCTYVGTMEFPYNPPNIFGQNQQWQAIKIHMDNGTTPILKRFDQNNGSKPGIRLEQADNPEHINHYKQQVLGLTRFSEPYNAVVRRIGFDPYHLPAQHDRTFEQCVDLALQYYARHREEYEPQ